VAKIVSREQRAGSRGAERREQRAEGRE